MLLAMGSTRPRTVDTLIANLRALMRANGIKKPQLAIKSGVSERMIGYILAGEKTPTVEVAEALAKPFGLTGWQLIMPHLPIELAKTGKLNRLIDNYAHSSESGRDYIDRVAEQEAKYQARK